MIVLYIVVSIVVLYGVYRFSYNLGNEKGYTVGYSLAKGMFASRKIEVSSKCSTNVPKVKVAKTTKKKVVKKTK